MESKYVVLLLLSVLVAAGSQVLLKKSANEKHGSLLKEYLNPRVIVGYGLMVVSTLLVILAYRGLDYKHGPIIEAVSYPVIMLVSLWVFGEKITPRKLVGNILILVGIAVFHL